MVRPEDDRASSRNLTKQKSELMKHANVLARADQNNSPKLTNCNPCQCYLVDPTLNMPRKKEKDGHIKKVTKREESVDLLYIAKVHITSIIKDI